MCVLEAYSVFNLHAMFGEQMKAEISCKVFVYPPLPERSKPIYFATLNKSTATVLVAEFLKISVTQIQVSPYVTQSI